MIIKEKTYPYIEIECSTRYIELGINIDVSVFLYSNKNTKMDITVECELYTLDSNVKIEESTIYSFEEGTFIITALYQGLYTKKEMVVYSSFFRDNYLMNFMSQYDMTNIESDNILKALFDTLFEFVDIIYAYQKDVDGIKNPLRTKEKFLDILADDFGLVKTENIYENNSLETIASKVYRSVLSKLLDILEIRGTLASYELFFEILGYDIELFEFWFDDNENLVEINVTDFTKSTFLKYNLNGEVLDDIEQTFEDPRINISDNIYKNNKSNYIRIKYTKNDNLVTEYVHPKSIIQEYLNYLKPNHINYLVEILGLSTNDEYFNRLIDGELGYKESVIGGDDPPPVVIENIFISTKAKLYVLGDVTNSLFQFISDDIMFITGDSEVVIRTNSFSFNAINSVLYINGSVETGVYSFISESTILNVIDTGIIEAAVYLIFSTSNLGPQTGRVITWKDYLEQEDRDNFETGFKYIASSGFRLPSDFFSRDFRYSDRTKTYNDYCSFSKTLALSDIISTRATYDTGLMYDTGDAFYDSFTFFIENAIDSKSELLTSFGVGELRNLYLFYKTENPQLPSEVDSDYKLRLSNMVISNYLEDGVVLSLGVLNEYLVNV